MSLKSFLRQFLPRRIRPHRILAGPLRGAQIVTSWHDYPGAILGRTELQLLKWFSANVHPGETWLDIGAHYGYTALALSRLVGPGGRVFAFEPMVSTAGYVAQTRLLNRCHHLTILPLAIAEPESLGLERLFTVRGMVDSTLARNKDDGQKGESLPPWEETFMVARLDWLWPRICGEKERIDGVKIDVQGMELEVLHGMMGVLRASKPKLVIEIHRGVDRPELLNLVEAAGYGSRAVPIAPIDGESDPQFLDDQSYAFQAI